jgi:hypothetical protein
MRILSWLLLAPCLAIAADPPKAAPPLPGEKMIQAYFQRQAKEIGDAALRDIKTKDDWEKAKPELRRQLLEMLGLWPMPARTELNAKITGKLERPKFTVEKIVFESMPGLYVTANLYVPKLQKGTGPLKPEGSSPLLQPAPAKAPTILYVCGHGNNVKDGVSFGSKTFYQHHPAW